MMPLNQITEKLKGVNLKTTSQRIVILRAISEMKNHPTPEFVYSAIKEENPGITLATVYKTLETFSDCGLVNKITTADGKLRYDPNIQDHNHIYCTNTDEIIDFYDDELDAILKEFMTKKHIDNFEINDYKFLVKGKKIDTNKQIKIY